jgi:multidrug efflux pump subunit AcrA (membrane-fusion protein)
LRRAVWPVQVFSGQLSFVEKIDVEVGESVQALADTIRIVRIDPLRIDVHVPQDKAHTVKVGDPAIVKFPKPQKKSSLGKVIFVSRAADAASATLRARIEVPNKSNRPSGESAHIVFLASEKQPVDKDIIEAEKPKDTKSN